MTLIQKYIPRDNYSKEEFDEDFVVDRNVKNEFNIPEGNYVGLQSGYIVTIPDIATFKTKAGVRGMNCRIYCIITKDNIKVEQQKYDDSMDAYRPYDWENQEYIPIEKFINKST